MDYPTSIVYHYAWLLNEKLFLSPDMNECADDALNNCNTNVSCTYTEPGFFCYYNEGFSRDLTMCDSKKMK